MAELTTMLVDPPAQPAQMHLLLIELVEQRFHPLVTFQRDLTLRRTT